MDKEAKCPGNVLEEWYFDLVSYDIADKSKSFSHLTSADNNYLLIEMEPQILRTGIYLPLI